MKLTRSGLSNSGPARAGRVGSSETHVLTATRGTEASPTPTPLSSVARSATSTPGGDADEGAGLEQSAERELLALEPLALADEARAHTLYTHGIPPIICSIVTPATRIGRSSESGVCSAADADADAGAGGMRVSCSSSGDRSGGSSARVNCVLYDWQVTSPRESSFVPARKRIRIRIGMNTVFRVHSEQ